MLLPVTCSIALSAWNLKTPRPILILPLPISLGATRINRKKSLPRCKDLSRPSAPNCARKSSSAAEIVSRYTNSPFCQLSESGPNGRRFQFNCGTTAKFDYRCYAAGLKRALGEIAITQARRRTSDPLFSVRLVMPAMRTESLPDATALISALPIAPQPTIPIDLSTMLSALYSLLPALRPLRIRAAISQSLSSLIRIALSINGTA